MNSYFETLIKDFVREINCDKTGMTEDQRFMFKAGVYFAMTEVQMRSEKAANYTEFQNAQAQVQKELHDFSQSELRNRHIFFCDGCTRDGLSAAVPHV